MVSFLVASLCLALPPQDPLGTWEKLTVNGVERTFLFHQPDLDAKKNVTIPLVLVFHGYGSSAKQMATYSRFNELADKKKFCVAYAEGVDHMWRVPGLGHTARLKPEDDVAFARAMIDKASELLNRNHVDSKAIYATGISNGGMFAIYLAEALNDKLAAIGPVAGTLYGIGASLKLYKPVPAILFHGTADKFVPYKGSGKLMTSAEATAALLANLNHDEGPSVPEELTDKVATDGCSVKRITFKGKDEVVFYSISGGGHTWPGSPLPPAVEKRLGPPCLDIDATELIWDFFQRHRRS